MFVQMRRTVVKEGFKDKVLERFQPKEGKPSLLEKREGFIGREILVKKHAAGKKKLSYLFAGNRKRLGRHGKRVQSILLVIKNRLRNMVASRHNQTILFRVMAAAITYYNEKELSLGSSFFVEMGIRK